jgi:hypothetical protein
MKLRKVFYTVYLMVIISPSHTIVYNTFMSFVLRSKYKKDLNTKKARYKKDRILKNK